MTESKSLLAKKFAVGVGIAIIFPMMIHYGVRTFSPPPDWRDYRAPMPVYEESMTPEAKKLNWEEMERREAERRKEETRFQKHLFYVAAPAGVIAILAGSFIAVQAVGAGLMFGGIFALIDGYRNYWSELPDAMRFVSLIAAFLVLLFIGWRKIGNK